jgi:hypothetical protein
MMVENILHAEQLEEQGDDKDMVRGIGAVDQVEAMGHEDPDRKREFPEQSVTILNYLRGLASAFAGRMPVYPDPLKELRRIFRLIAVGADYAYGLAELVRRACFTPYAGIGGRRGFLHNKEDVPFLYHESPS